MNRRITRVRTQGRTTRYNVATLTCGHETPTDRKPGQMEWCPECATPRPLHRIECDCPNCAEANAEWDAFWNEHLDRMARANLQTAAEALREWDEEQQAAETFRSPLTDPPEWRKA